MAVLPFNARRLYSKSIEMESERSHNVICIHSSTHYPETDIVLLLNDHILEGREGGGRKDGIPRKGGSERERGRDGGRERWSEIGSERWREGVREGERD